MRIVVIGGTRFMGPHVVRSLGGAGHDVTVFHRGIDCRDAAHVHGDRMQLPHDLHGDIVVDMWCMTEAHAKAAAEHFRSERYVVISSADVYRNYDGLRGRYTGPPDPVPLREDAPLREKLYPYDDDYEKILVERTLPSDRMTILRLPAVYGPRDEQHRFAPWLKQMSADTIQIDIRQADFRWTRGYSENIADAIVLAALDDAAAGKTYNVGEPDAPTDKEWVRMVGEAAGWHGRIETAENVEGTLPVNFAYDLATNTSAIRRDLRYSERIPRAEALAATVTWERSRSRARDELQ
jgi:nucleoside-diphosphate-sugar epimerase